MHCVNDNILYLPLPIENLLVNLASSRDIIMATLELIQTSFNNNTNRDGPKLIEALEASYLLSKDTGAKLLLFCGSNSIAEHVRMYSIIYQNINSIEL
jgi:hypothetical protein